MAAEVFILGCLDHAKDFGEDDLLVSFEIICGPLWEQVTGTNAAQTSVTKKNPYSGFHTWLHPIDVHYSAQCIQGWPKIVTRVWQIDKYGRKDFVGYGMAHVPLPTPLTSASQMSTTRLAMNSIVKVEVWKPMRWTQSFWTNAVQYLRQLVMGGAPRLKNDSLVHTSEGRYKLYSSSGGTLIFKLNVLCKNFGNLAIAVE